MPVNSVSQKLFVLSTPFHSIHRMLARQLAGSQTTCCTLGCSVLDHFFGGGVPCGSITELTGSLKANYGISGLVHDFILEITSDHVAGEAAASKTQVCLQLLLTCQLPVAYGGLNGRAVYVYTEGEPAMARLQELSSLLKFRVPPAALATVPDPTDNIFIEKGISTGQELLLRLDHLQPLLQRQDGGRRVRLIVVDSIAHVFRDLEDGGGVEELSGRTELLFRIAALLRRYADDYNLAVVVTNQIADAMGGRQAGQLPGRAAAAGSAGYSGGLRLMSSGREVLPALGLAWANCINSRVFLSRAVLADGATPLRYGGQLSSAAQRAAAERDNGQAPAAAPQLRSMRVVFSPFLPQSECAYVVEQTGVRGLHPAELQNHCQHHP